MKYIKHSLVVVLCCLAIMTFNGCNKALDIVPASSYTGDNVFTTPDKVLLALYGVYSSYGEAWTTCRLYNIFLTDTDEGMMTGPDNDNTLRGIARWGPTPTNTTITPVYSTLYEGIERANICIEKIPAMDMYSNGSVPEKALLERMYGEALTLRALMYYELVRWFGDVPFKTKPSVVGENFNLPRTSRDTIYDHILADLVTAAALVPWQSEVTQEERVTKGAVKGVAARIALAAAGYSLRWDLATGAGIGMKKRNDLQRITELYKIARDQAYDVIYSSASHDLLPRYEDVFRNFATKKYDKETIFQIGYYGNNANNRIAYENGPDIREGSKYGKSNSNYRVTPSYYYAFDSVDTRRDLAICNHFVDAANVFKGVAFNNLTPGKWRLYWRSSIPIQPLKTDFNWVILRFSDVLLMFAEAENEINNGPTAQAKECFERVRTRAYTGNLSAMGTTPATYSGFFNAVANERYLELGFEGYRKADLIRWNLLTQRLNKVKSDFAVLKTGGNPFTTVASVPQYVYVQEKTWDPVPLALPFRYAVTTGYVRYNWRQQLTTTPNFANYFTPNKSELLPIPQIYIEGQSALKQHPGF